ncbi:hypothetical protein [Nocardioides sp.]|uniref:hypothetical protein n=1 Tax=Nocardioides sp. TaxID=35761 RepID=UPI00261B5931|nr:hypothetical protein [Nocardioides sp.]MCW2739074.1 hypothetical protein [Nocardioides sp.]
MVRLLVLLATAMLLSGCEEKTGQDAWLRIDNTTTERVYVQERDKTGDDYVIGVGPGESELAPGYDPCDDSELVARSGSTSGPVVGTRTSDQGRDCIGTWVIGTSAETTY